MCFADQGNAPEFSVRGRNGAVSSEVDVCSNIGAGLLQQGGSAVDAIIGTALCVGSIASYHSGLGGGGHALLRSKGGKSYYHIDFRETAPAAATEDMYTSNPVKNASLYGGLAVGTPGEPRAWYELHQKYGKLPWKTIFEPAITLNRDGFKVTYELSKAINTTQYPFLCTESLWAEVYCPDGKPAELGQTIKKPRFADTLELIAEQGIQPFYNGEIATDIVDTIQNNKVLKGITTKQDLADYTVEWRTPNSVSIRDGKYRVYGTVAPSSGNVVLSTLLTADQFSNADLKSVNVSTHRLIEANKFSYGERTTYGDPNPKFGFGNISTLQKEYLRLDFAKEKSGKIVNDRTFNTTYYNPSNSSILNDHGTSAITVVDADGMAISLTTTINTFWGSTLMTQHGFPLNNEMDDFSSPGSSNFFGFVPTAANFIRPGKRPLSSISAVIVEEEQDKKLKLSTSSAGGSRIITAVTQVAYNVLFKGMDAQSALAEPRWHDQLSPNQTTVERYAQQIPDFLGFSNQTAAFLAQVGHNVTWTAIGSSTAQAVERFRDGTLLAATEVRQLAAKGSAF
ncbi:gamma-glutamyltranspeptidase [Testicularia cyperi]|uniref:Glutathione hydrolase n=1 Tax=Testicularia cyperi TaxID=1882483 RepID=A0A317XH42_9BASI|nr:gamma-glutamyltranspeptidase [Testicularia cyperi]